MPVVPPPASFQEPKMPSTSTSAGNAVACSPDPNPWMMFVACPVTDARAVFLTGENLVEV